MTKAPASAHPFERRHIGPGDGEIAEMLEVLGYESLDALIETAIPASIRFTDELSTGEACTEHEALGELAALAAGNRILRSYLGLGYHDCITPPVLLRKILENPGWYTAYTPYQAEIAQGRLEALLNFQTACIDLTGLPVANASLLDEGTAAAEAMSMCHAVGPRGRDTFFVSELCHPQTIEVVKTRARARGWTVTVGDHRTCAPDDRVFGGLVQYPATDGAVLDYGDFVQAMHDAGGLVVVASDLLALTLLTPPGEWGADAVVGNSQRFGVPLGYGGPHAAFFSTREDYKRHLPGRIIGVSHDSRGQPALRMALQTREQHIRREKATSNVCTAQVLLAVVAGFYAVYHGPDGLVRIARHVHRLARALAAGLQKLGYTVSAEPFFDTVAVRIDGGAAARDAIVDAALDRGMNLRVAGEDAIIVAFDETTSEQDVGDLLDAFAAGRSLDVAALLATAPADVDTTFRRTTAFLEHPVFHRYRSETEMLRYIQRLESRDLSLTTSMISLGSCTMKLNAAAEMLPITWPGFGRIHPFVPRDQAKGYTAMFEQLNGWLAHITGFSAVSLQPNAGSQGELTGLLVIRAWQEDRGQGQRDVCLIPQSAHGTNPASSVMAGLRVVVVKSDEHGNIDVDDLRAKAEEHAEHLAALMVTYPSTHGIFEESIKAICAIVHEHGGQVYMDGANMNAMVGLSRPGDIGADVCHLNLHKTFCIPHGGGGPGMGPIAVASHLAPFLPGHPVVPTGGEKAIGPVSAAPWGSPSILPISWAYIRMMGGAGLTNATKAAILNANYVAHRLNDHFPVLYAGRNGTVAHECIVDPRSLKGTSGVEAVDIAKRLMDYGFHAPTVSFPVPGTLMVEPTESESKAELDRFCDALIAIREEIREIEMGIADRQDNLLKNAPHTADMVTADEWSHPYSRERAAYPAPWTREHKFWPAVGLIDNASGDRNLVCACPPMEEYVEVG